MRFRFSFNILDISFPPQAKALGPCSKSCRNLKYYDQFRVHEAIYSRMHSGVLYSCRISKQKGPKRKDAGNP